MQIIILSFNVIKFKATFATSKFLKMKKLLVLSIVSSLLIVACVQGDKTKETESKNVATDTELLNTAQNMFAPISSVDMVQPHPDKVALGKFLYFDTRLSGEGNISCNSCHDLNTYGVDNKKFSEGDDGSLGGRNSPTVIHAALHSMQFWDGRAKDVEEQAGGPILNPVEHNIKNKEELMVRIKDVELYRDLFAKVYKDESEPITFDNLTNAIGAFERTLMPESRFDKYLEGDMAVLTAQEESGLKLFINTGCITCHSGVALGGQMFQKFGLYHEYWKYTASENIDNGLFDLSENENEKYFFKVPGLRNIAHTAPYFHDGSVDDLGEAVKIMAKLQRDMELTGEEVKDIVAFLNTLSADLPEDVKENPFNKKL